MKSPRFIKRVSKWTMWTTALVVTSATTGQAMGVVAPSSSQDAWKDVRREMSKNTMSESFSNGLVEVLQRLETGTDYRLVMRLSYSIARPNEFEALDTFWTRYMVERGEETGLNTLMEIRNRAMGAAKVTRQNYLESWLYLARNGGGYDCGGNCGNGNGGGGIGNGGSNGNGNANGHSNGKGRNG